MLQLGDKGTTTWFKCLVCSRCYPVEEKLIVHKTTTNCRFHYAKAFKRHKRDYKRLKVLKRNLGYVVSDDHSSTDSDSSIDSSGSVIIEAVIPSSAKRPRLESQVEQKESRKLRRICLPPPPLNDDGDADDESLVSEDHLSTAETLVVASPSCDVPTGSDINTTVEMDTEENLAVVDDVDIKHFPAPRDSPPEETAPQTSESFDNDCEIVSAPADPGNNECYFCSEKFPTFMTLTRHMRKHTMEKEFQCRGCNSFFAYRHQMEYHLFKSRTCH